MGVDICSLMYEVRIKEPAAATGSLSSFHRLSLNRLGKDLGNRSCIKD